jgi:L-alanine-DL-glutamate epimerase-like enolase superfamily enzyme
MAAQETLIVQLTEDGEYGYGEATTNSYYGATNENMVAVLESVRSLVEAHRLEDPLPLIAEIKANLPIDDFAMFALSALDQAIHDLWGKLRGAPVYRLWGLSTDNIPMSDYTLGIDTPEDGGQAARNARLARVQDQARHGGRSGPPARATPSHGRHVPRGRELRLVG